MFYTFTVVKTKKKKNINIWYGGFSDPWHSKIDHIIFLEISHKTFEGHSFQIKNNHPAIFTGVKLHVFNFERDLLEMELVALIPFSN